MEMHKRDFDQEKEYLSDIFCSDAKNYHAWSYRLWFIERFNLWEGELEFVESQLHEGQVTNNSLWSYRYFLIMKTQAFTQDLVARELAFTMDCLQRFNMRNEAAWVYLKGLLAQSKAEQEASQAGNVKRWFILDFPQVKEWIQSQVTKNEANAQNRFLISTLLDFATAAGDRKEAITLLQRLKSLDRLRENYY